MCGIRLCITDTQLLSRALLVPDPQRDAVEPLGWTAAQRERTWGAETVAGQQPRWARGQGHLAWISSSVAARPGLRVL